MAVNPNVQWELFDVWDSRLILVIAVPVCRVNSDDIKHSFWEQWTKISESVFHSFLRLIFSFCSLSGEFKKCIKATIIWNILLCCCRSSCLTLQCLQIVKRRIREGFCYGPPRAVITVAWTMKWHDIVESMSYSIQSLVDLHTGSATTLSCSWRMLELSSQKICFYVTFSEGDFLGALVQRLLIFFY